MSIEICYAQTALIPSFYKAMDQVAREEIFIEKTEAPPFEDVQAFQEKLIRLHWPNYYAVQNQRVIGWADITRPQNERLAHRGFLGMGLVPEARGQGLGSQLLERALNHAQQIGIEKIELSVYSNNPAAIALYHKFGFQKMGRIRHYRKLRDTYFDTVEMELFFDTD